MSELSSAGQRIIKAQKNKTGDTLLSVPVRSAKMPMLTRAENIPYRTNTDTSAEINIIVVSSSS
jgi:hypothetical protein